MSRKKRINLIPHRAYGYDPCPSELRATRTTTTATVRAAQATTPTATMLTSEPETRTRQVVAVVVEVFKTRRRVIRSSDNKCSEPPLPPPTRRLSSMTPSRLLLSLPLVIVVLATYCCLEADHSAAAAPAAASIAATSQESRSGRGAAGAQEEQPTRTRARALGEGKQVELKQRHKHREMVSEQEEEEEEEDEEFQLKPTAATAPDDLHQNLQQQQQQLLPIVVAGPSGQSKSTIETAPIRNMTNFATTTTANGTTASSLRRTSTKRRGRRRKRWNSAPGSLQPRQQKQAHSGNSSTASQRQHSDEQQKAGLEQNPPMTVIYGMLRGQVILKCNLKPIELEEDEVSLILWYKDVSAVPIFSVDARASPVLEARHKPGSWLEGRSTLRIVEEEEEEAAAAAAVAADEEKQQPASRQPEGIRRWRRRRLLLLGDSDQDEDEQRQQQQQLSENLARLESIWSPYDSKAANTRRQQQQQQQPLASAPQEHQLPEPEARVNERPQQQQQQQRRARRHHLVANLHVDSLSSQDNGLYKCRVDFRRSRSRIEEQELRIIVPAEKPLIRDLTAATPTQGATLARNNMVGPHNEMSRVVLECETSGGYPEPALTWWRDGRLVDDSYEIVSGSDGRVLERRGGGGTQDTDPNSAASGEEVRPASLSLSSSSSSAKSQPSQQTSPSSNILIRNRLELLGLTRDDLLANYSCQAWNSKLGEPPTSYVVIDMNLRPIKVQIDNERLPVRAQRPVEIVCRAFGSRPAALVSWYLNENRLVGSNDLGGGPSSSTNTQQQQQQKQQQPPQINESISSDSNITTSVLSFTPQIAHSGQLLTCRAENGFITSQQLLHQHQQQQLQQASGGDLEGGGAGALLPAAFQEPPPSMMMHLEDSWKLEVHYLPRVKLALGEKLASRQAAIQVGHDVYFECSTQAQPAVHALRWWFNGKELETNVSQGVIISNQSLVLQRVSRHQRGEYTCSAINSVGESHSNAVFLRIQHQPYCRDITGGRSLVTSTQGQDETPESGTRSGAIRRPTQHNHHKTHYGAARLESVKVYCHVEADPSESVTFKWAFVAHNSNKNAAASQANTNGNQDNHGRAPSSSQNDLSSSLDSGGGKPSGMSAAQSKQPDWSGQQVVYLNSSQVSPNDPLESVLDYTPKSELDYGTLLCWAQNALGQQAEPCVYQVVPAERPEPVRNCRLLNASESQLAIACEPGYDGGIDQSFHMEVYEVNTKQGDQQQLLVANVTNIPGLSSSLFASAVSGSNNNNNNNNNSLEANDDDPNQEPSSSDLGSMDSDSQQDESDSGHHVTSTSKDPGHQLAASLVSETTPTQALANSSRQQKQRHSYHQQRPTASWASHAGQATEQKSGSNNSNSNSQAIFLTEPQLAPSTDYLISIYSANSKGASKPVAFTASTSNQSAWGVFGSAFAKANFELSGREGRRNHPASMMSVPDQTSALVNEVFSLTWSPFLLVCAVTILIFVLFASVTFALIKYVDLTGLVVAGQRREQTGGGGSAGDAKPSAHQAGSGYAASVHSSMASGNDNTPATTNAQHQLRRGEVDGHEHDYDDDDDGRLTSVTVTSRNRARGTGDEYSFELHEQQQHHHHHHHNHHNQHQDYMSATLGRPPATRARVIAIGTEQSHQWPTISATADDTNEIPLNGMIPLGLNGLGGGSIKRSSLLNGSYLKAKLQQLTSGQQLQQQQQQQQLARMKQSNSDNHLSQADELIMACKSHCPQLATNCSGPDHSSNWFQYRAPHYQATYWAAGGTLPRASTTVDNHHPDAVQMSNQLQQQQQRPGGGYVEEVAPAASAVAYGYLKVVSNSHLSGHHLQQQHLPLGRQQFELSAKSNSNSNSNVASAVTSTFGNVGGGPSSSVALSSQAPKQFGNGNQASGSANLNSNGLVAVATANNADRHSPPQAMHHQSHHHHHHHNHQSVDSCNSSGPIEHLLFGAKQCAQQTRPISTLNDHHQQPQQLQMTSSANHQQLPSDQQQQQIGLFSGGGGANLNCCSHPTAATNNSTPQTPQAVCNHNHSNNNTNQHLANLTNSSAATALANCCGDQQQHQSNYSTPPKTSDLGDDVPEEDLEFDGQGPNFNRFDTALAHSNQQAISNNKTDFATGSDGMSSQGTQRSGLTTSNLSTATSTIFTNGSPSSGYEPELMPSHILQQQQQQHLSNGGSTASTLTSTTTTCGNHQGLSDATTEGHLQFVDQQQQQQLVQCNTLKPATKSAGLRHTKKSLTFDPNGLPTGYYPQMPGPRDCRCSPQTSIDHNNKNNNNNNIDQQLDCTEAQFFLLPPNTDIDHSNDEDTNNQHQHSSSLVRLANKTRVRLISASSAAAAAPPPPPNNQQRLDYNSYGTGIGTGGRHSFLRNSTNKHHHHHQQQQQGEQQQLPTATSSSSSNTGDDLARSPGDLQTISRQMFDASNTHTRTPPS